MRTTGPPASSVARPGTSIVTTTGCISARSKPPPPPAAPCAAKAPRPTPLAMSLAESNRSPTRPASAATLFAWPIPCKETPHSRPSTPSPTTSTAPPAAHPITTTTGTTWPTAEWALISWPSAGIAALSPPLTVSATAATLPPRWPDRGATLSTTIPRRASAFPPLPLGLRSRFLMVIVRPRRAPGPPARSSPRRSCASRRSIRPSGRGTTSA